MNQLLKNPYWSIKNLHGNDLIKVEIIIINTIYMLLYKYYTILQFWLFKM